MDLPPLAFLPGFSQPLGRSCWCIAPVVTPPPHSLFHWLLVTHSGLSWFGLYLDQFGCQVCVHSAVSAICTPAHPPALKCLIAWQTHRLNIPVWKMMCFTSVTVISMFPSVWSKPKTETTHPEQETQRFTSGFAQDVLGFVF